VDVIEIKRYWVHKSTFKFIRNLSLIYTKKKPLKIKNRYNNISFKPELSHPGVHDLLFYPLETPLYYSIL